MSDFEQDVRSELKEIRNAVSELKVIAATNTTQLETHMKRTEMNEARIESMEKWHLGILAAILIAVITKAVM